MLSGLCEWDRRIAEARKDDPRAILQLKEAFRQGGDGAYRDLMLVSHAWGLDLAANTVPTFLWHGTADRSEEHTSELQSLMRISYAVFCLKKKNYNIPYTRLHSHQHSQH